jgi:hypothetical protein
MHRTCRKVEKAATRAGPARASVAYSASPEWAMSFRQCYCQLQYTTVPILVAANRSGDTRQIVPSSARSVSGACLVMTFFRYQPVCFERVTTPPGPASMYRPGHAAVAASRMDITAKRIVRIMSLE